MYSNSNRKSNNSFEKSIAKIVNKIIKNLHILDTDYPIKLMANNQ